MNLRGPGFGPGYHHPSSGPFGATPLNALLLAQSNEENIRSVIGSVGEALQSPTGLLGVAAAIALFIYAGLTREGWRLAFITTLLLAMMVDGSGRFFNNTLFSPLQQVRSSSQFTAVAMLGLLAVATMRFGRPTWSRIAGGIAVSFLFFELYYGVRLVLSEQLLRGGLAIVTFTLIFLAVPMGIGRTLSSPEGIEKLIRTYALVSIPYIVFNLMQYAFSPNYTIVSGRFAGISGNPQHAAMMFAFLTVTLAWLLSRPRENWIVLPVFAVMIGLSVLLVAWTGSRTGALAGFIGVVLIFRKQAVALVLVGGFTAGAALLAATIVGEGQDAFERITSTENTRQQVWMMGLEEFVKTPIFGGLGDPSGANMKVIESTPIQTLQVLGVSGFVPLLLTYLCIIMSVVRLQAIRRVRTDLRAAIDYTTAMWAMVLLMSIFEAIFLGILTFFNLTIYMLAAITAAIIAMGRVDMSETEEEEEWSDTTDHDHHPDDGPDQDDFRESEDMGDRAPAT